MTKLEMQLLVALRQTRNVCGSVAYSSTAPHEARTEALHAYGEAQAALNAATLRYAAVFRSFDWCWLLSRT